MLCITAPALISRFESVRWRAYDNIGNRFADFGNCHFCTQFFCVWWKQQTGSDGNQGRSEGRGQAGGKRADGGGRQTVGRHPARKSGGCREQYGTGTIQGVQRKDYGGQRILRHSACGNR